jgi:hypothetical protein
MFAQHQKVAIKFDPGAHLAFAAMGTGIIYCACKNAACVRVRESIKQSRTPRARRVYSFLILLCSRVERKMKSGATEVCGPEEQRATRDFVFSAQQPPLGVF